MPQIPAAIPTQAFELIRNRIAEILVDELPSQATFAGDPKLNATVYVERSVMFDLIEMPAVNVSVSRTAYSEQTQRNTDGEHTFTIDVHTSAKSTSSVRGDSLAAFRLQKLLGVCRGILEDSRYKTLGFAPPFIESRKVTSIEYAQPTDGDGTSSVQGRITFVVRAPDRNGVITPDLIAGYDTQVKLGLTEKGYIFTGDNIPVPPIVGAEISVNGTFYIDAEAGDEVDIPVRNSEGDEVGTVTPSVGVEVPDATYTLVDTDTPPNTLGSGSIASGAAETIVAPAATVTVNTTPFGTAPSGGGLNVPVVNGGSNPVGSEQSGEWVIGNSTVTINGTQVGDIVAEDSLPLAVELDGNPSGTWNAGTQTWEVTGGASGSVAVTVSDAAPDFGDTITITATPTGLTPTSYLFFAFDGTDIKFIAEQAGAVANWTVSLSGTFEIYVLATDGTIEAYSSEEVVVSTVYVCDLITPQPVFGFALRRLSASYIGDAALVRRTSDGASLAIGYIGEDFDTAAMTSFVGVGNGFDVTFYNQFAVNHATQVTAALQPSMVVGGVVNMLGGKPTMVFNGAYYLTMPTPVSISHLLAVAQASTISGAASQELMGGAAQAFGFAGSGVTGIYMFDSFGGFIQTTIENTLPHQVSYRLGGAGRIRVDGSTAASGTISSSISVSRIGSRSDIFGREFRGNISELIGYSSILSDADEQIIEANQKLYYAL